MHSMLRQNQVRYQDVKPYIRSFTRNNPSDYNEWAKDEGGLFEPGILIFLLEPAKRPPGMTTFAKAQQGQEVVQDAFRVKDMCVVVDKIEGKSWVLAISPSAFELRFLDTLFREKAQKSMLEGLDFNYLACRPRIPITPEKMKELRQLSTLYSKSGSRRTVAAADGSGPDEPAKAMLAFLGADLGASAGKQPVELGSIANMIFAPEGVQENKLQSMVKSSFTPILATDKLKGLRPTEPSPIPLPEPPEPTMQEINEEVSLLTPSYLQNEAYEAEIALKTSGTPADQVAPTDGGNWTSTPAKTEIVQSGSYDEFKPLAPNPAVPAAMAETEAPTPYGQMGSPPQMLGEQTPALEMSPDIPAILTGDHPVIALDQKLSPGENGQGNTKVPALPAWYLTTHDLNEMNQVALKRMQEAPGVMPEGLDRLEAELSYDALPVVDTRFKPDGETPAVEPAAAAPAAAPVSDLDLPEPTNFEATADVEQISFVDSIFEDAGARSSLEYNPDAKRLSATEIKRAGDATARSDSGPPTTDWSKPVTPGFVSPGSTATPPPAKPTSDLPADTANLFDRLTGGQPNETPQSGETASWAEPNRGRPTNLKDMLTADSAVFTTQDKGKLSTDLPVADAAEAVPAAAVEAPVPDAAEAVPTAAVEAPPPAIEEPVAQAPQEPAKPEPEAQAPQEPAKPEPEAAVTTSGAVDDAPWLKMARKDKAPAAKADDLADFDEVDLSKIPAHLIKEQAPFFTQNTGTWQVNKTSEDAILAVVPVEPVEPVEPEPQPEPVAAVPESASELPVPNPQVEPQAAAAEPTGKDQENYNELAAALHGLMDSNSVEEQEAATAAEPPKAESSGFFDEPELPAPAAEAPALPEAEQPLIPEPEAQAPTPLEPERAPFLPANATVAPLVEPASTETSPRPAMEMSLFDDMDVMDDVIKAAEAPQPVAEPQASIDYIDDDERNRELTQDLDAEVLQRLNVRVATPSAPLMPPSEDEEEMPAQYSATEPAVPETQDLVSPAMAAQLQSMEEVPPETPVIPPLQAIPKPKAGPSRTSSLRSRFSQELTPPPMPEEAPASVEPQAVEPQVAAFEEPEVASPQPQVAFEPELAAYEPEPQPEAAASLPAPTIPEPAASVPEPTIPEAAPAVPAVSRMEEPAATAASEVLGTSSEELFVIASSEVPSIDVPSRAMTPDQELTSVPPAVTAAAATPEMTAPAASTTPEPASSQLMPRSLTDSVGASASKEINLDDSGVFLTDNVLAPAANSLTASGAYQRVQQPIVEPKLVISESTRFMARLNQRLSEADKKLSNRCEQSRDRLVREMEALTEDANKVARQHEQSTRARTEQLTTHLETVAEEVRNLIAKTSKESREEFQQIIRTAELAVVEMNKQLLAELQETETRFQAESESMSEETRLSLNKHAQLRLDDFGKKLDEIAGALDSVYKHHINVLVARFNKFQARLTEEVDAIITSLDRNVGSMTVEIDGSWDRASEKLTASQTEFGNSVSYLVQSCRAEIKQVHLDAYASKVLPRLLENKDIFRSMLVDMKRNFEEQSERIMKQQISGLTRSISQSREELNTLTKECLSTIESVGKGQQFGLEDLFKSTSSRLDEMTTLVESRLKKAKQEIVDNDNAATRTSETSRVEDEPAFSKEKQTAIAALNECRTRADNALETHISTSCLDLEQLSEEMQEDLAKKRAEWTAQVRLKADDSISKIKQAIQDAFQSIDSTKDRYME